MKQEPAKEARARSGRKKNRASDLVVQPIKRAGPCRQRETTLQLPVGEPDLEALRSVTREWLVPLLVEKFLREQGVELRARSNAGPGKSPISDL